MHHLRNAEKYRENLRKFWSMSSALQKYFLNIVKKYFENNFTAPIIKLVEVTML